MARVTASSARTKMREADHKAEIEAMKTFQSALADHDTVSLTLSECDVFYDIIDDAHRRGYVHYTRLAAVMGLRDSTTVSRWFNRKACPDRFRRRFALSALEKIIANDIRRMQSDPQKPPVGYLSMKEYPDIEVEVVDLVA